MKNKETFVKIFVITVFFVFAFTMVYVNTYMVGHKSLVSKYFLNADEVLDNEIKTLIESQTKTDELIKNIINSNEYTIDSPYVQKNPYEIAPLSALVIFKTKDKVSIKISINDKYVTTTEEETSHVIPVYGLYSNTNNFVRLELSNGTTKDIMIQTTAYDDSYTGSLNKLKNDEQLMTLTNESYKSFLRIFDKYGNLISYTSFDKGYLKSYSKDNDYLYLNYLNQKSENQGIILKVDYLGKIYNVSTGRLNGSSEQIVNMYKEITKNYELKEIHINDEYETPKTYEANLIEKDLNDAKKYNILHNIYKISDYLFYDFREPVTLILIGKDSGTIYEYEVDKSGVIKIDVKEESAIYIKVNNKYYYLEKIIKN